MKKLYIDGNYMFFNTEEDIAEYVKSTISEDLGYFIIDLIERSSENYYTHVDDFENYEQECECYYHEFEEVEEILFELEEHITGARLNRKVLYDILNRLHTCCRNVGVE